MGLPFDSAERKRIPMYTGLRVYFPDALAAVAAHSFASNEKHNPGEPCHWAREKSNDHMDCIDRHLTDIAAKHGDLDVRVSELKAVVWRALAQLQLDLEEQAIRDAAERARIVRQERADEEYAFKPLNRKTGRFEVEPYGGQGAYGPGASGFSHGSFDVVSTPQHCPDGCRQGPCVCGRYKPGHGPGEIRHNVGETGACDCPVCITGSLEPR